jgi:YfiH family protein
VTQNKSPFLTVSRLAAIPGLVHGFGGASWSEANFLAYAKSQGMRPVITRQLHSDTIHRLEAAPAKKLEGDALMTNVPGLLLVIRTADCLPVLLVDPKNKAVSAVHCGWRGTEKLILEKTVKAMGDAYGSKPADMVAALGPCIGGGCYEVGPEVREGFLRAGFPPKVFTERQQDEPRPLLDLRAANIYLLERQGLKKTSIFCSDSTCTHCEPSLLSYRRAPHDPRRMYNFIGLRAFAF